MLYWFFIANLFLFCLALIGFGIKHVVTGRIYVGFGERYLYGRTWIRREEDPVLFWALAGSLIALGLLYLIFASSVLFFAPEELQNWRSAAVAPCYDLCHNAPV